MVNKLFYSLLLSLLFSGCNKEDLQWNLDKVDRLSTVNTLSTSNIFNTGATINGEIINDGGSPVTQRGVCWSTSQNPTIANNITINGSGLGS
jgi:hypothetical protein